MVVDSHVHFWYYNPNDYDWIDESMSIIKRDFLPADLKSQSKESGTKYCIAVQSEEQTTANDFLLSLAEQDDFIVAVVAWADFEDENVSSVIEKYSTYSKVVGFRYIIQGREKGFMLKPIFIDGISKLADYGLTYDLLLFENQLEEASVFVSRLPQNLDIVVDHIAKPDIKSKSFDDWRQGIDRLASFEHLSCKLSGMITEADWGNWTKDDLLPYLDHVFSAFGVDRIMYGSDWPVCTLAGSYNQVFDIVSNYINSMTAEDQAKVLYRNALSFYNISLPT